MFPNESKLLTALPLWYTFKEPDDGWNNYERMILRETIVSIYQKIEDPLNKFILCVTHECGYSQEEVARMLGVTQPAINKRLKKTLKKIRKLRNKSRL